MSEVAVPLYSLVALATFVLVAYLVVKFLVWLGGRLGAVGFIHPDRSVRLISLAIALLLFPTFVRDVFGYFSEAVRNFIFYTPGAISYSTSNVADACRDADGGQCFARAWDTYLQFLQDVLRATASRLGAGRPDAPQAGDLLQTAIYVLAVWVLVAQLLVAIFHINPMSPTLKRARRILVTTRKATVKNLALFVMLIFASYLSFASIAAIPTLEREEVPQDVDHTHLKALLEESATTLTTMLSPQSGTDLAEATFDTPSIQQAAEAQGITEAAFSDAKIAAVAKNSELIAQAGNLKAQLTDSLKTLESVAVSTYSTSNLKRIGARATIDHYQAIHGWFVEEMNALGNNLSECRRAIFAYQRASIITLSSRPAAQATASPTAAPAVAYPSSDDYGAWPKGGTKQMALEAGAPPAILPYAYAPAPSASASSDAAQYQEAVAACAFRYVQEAPPLRGNLQNYVGSFGVAINWLLSSESQPLVLIVGLLGFGLLGAACSTFVREVSRKVGDGALVEDLAGVVIRGVSAAVVVFLAVYGGLAIFGTNAEPNPYVVLFTCLVGAVFSDTVWDWAQTRLQESFSKESDGADDKPPRGGEEPDKKPPRGSAVEQPPADKPADAPA